MAAKKKTTTTKKATTSKKTSATKTSTETARWNGHKFKVSSKLIYGFDGLQIKGSSETEDKKKSGQQYVARKAGRPAEITMTVYLNAFTGCNVRSEAMKFINQAQKGKKDYFYVGTKKLVTYKLMLTDATVKEVEIAHNHTWTSAEVQLTFKQAEKGTASTNSKSKSSASSSGSGTGGSYSASGSKKVSVKTSSPVSVGVKVGAAVLGKTGAVIGAAVGTVAATAANVLKNALTGKSSTSSTSSAVKSATSTISRITSAAKSYSASTKKSSGSSGGAKYLALTR